MLWEWFSAAKTGRPVRIWEVLVQTNYERSWKKTCSRVQTTLD